MILIDLFICLIAIAVMLNPANNGDIGFLSFIGGKSNNNKGECFEGGRFKFSDFDGGNINKTLKYKIIEQVDASTCREKVTADNAANREARHPTHVARTDNLCCAQF